MTTTTRDAGVDLTIQIVSWNTCDQTLASVASIKNHASARYHVQVIVIDNASADATVQRLHQEYPDVCVIENESNLGFGRANNVGLRQAVGDVVLFLNSDAEVTPGFIDGLLEQYRDQESISALGCKIVGPDGFPQNSIRGFPSMGAYVYSDTLFGALGLFRKQHGAYRRKDFDFDSESRVEVAMGAALSFRRSVLQRLGGFDERFFMYFEEADLCKRLAEIGGILMYSPAVVVRHLGGVSAKKDKARMMLVSRQSMFDYFRKHEPAWKVRLFELSFKPLFVVHVGWHLLVDGLKNLVSGRSGKKYSIRNRVRAEFLTKYGMSFLRY